MSDSPAPSVQPFADVELNPELVIRLTPVIHGRSGRPNKVDLRLHRLSPIAGGAPAFHSTSAGFHLPIAQVDEFIARLRAVVSQSQG